MLLWQYSSFDKLNQIQHIKYQSKMKRFYIFLFALLLLQLATQAQVYQNEWIDYSKTYYKFKVGKSGVYRIPYTTLEAAGLNGLNGNGFRLYARGGKAVPIYVTQTGKLTNNDYIEFYATKNDGKFDTYLHKNASEQLSNLKSLFTDTLSYYLVWDVGSNGSWYANADNSMTGLPAAENYFMHEVLSFNNNVHSLGDGVKIAGANYWYADYEPNEGFSGQSILAPNSLDYNIKTPKRYTDDPDLFAKLETKIVGQTHSIYYNPDHLVDISVGSTKYQTAEFEGYSSIVTSLVVFMTDIKDLTKVSFKALELVGQNTDYTQSVSVVYNKLTYPRKFDFDNSKVFKFALGDQNEKYLAITNFDEGTTPVLYDLTNQIRMVPVISGDTLRFHLPKGSLIGLSRELILANTSSTTCLASSDNCFFIVDELKNTQFTDYSKTINQGNYLIVTHPKLRQGGTDYVQEYADYRASAQGGSYNVVVADITELYDQFSQGVEKHPLAIRNFVNYAIDNWSAANKPKFCLLLGKSVDYAKSTNSPSEYNGNLLPTYGKQPSDNVLVARNVWQYTPQLAVGRISAKNPTDVKNFLDKLKFYESPEMCSEEAMLWLKKGIHIALAHFGDDDEETEYLDYLNKFKLTYEDAKMGGKVIQTYSAKYGGTSFAGLQNLITNGVGLISFMGHSQGQYWDFKVPEFNNPNKYPFIISASCFVGNIHDIYASPSMAEDLTLAANSGCIGFLGTVSFGYPKYLDIFVDSLYNEFCKTNYAQPMGICLKNTIDKIYISDSTASSYDGIKATCEEFTFEGDPGFVLAGYAAPDYHVDNVPNSPDLVVKNNDNGVVLSPPYIVSKDVTSLEFIVNYANLGQAVDKDITVVVNRKHQGNTTVAATKTIDAAYFTGSFNVTIVIDSKTMGGDNEFTIIIDADEAITELCETNNKLVFNINVQNDIDCSQEIAPNILLTDLEYCTSDAPVTITTDKPGGIFNGTGISGNEFNPGVAGPGSHIITYTYTNPDNNCVTADNITINVSSIPSNEFTVKSPDAFLVNGESICKTTVLTIEATDYNPFATYTWSWNGANAIPLGNEKYSVSWLTAGIKTFSLKVSNSNCTTSVKDFVVNVDDVLPAPVINCGTSTLSSVSFEWAAVPGASGYLIDVDGSIQTIANTSYTITGLAPAESKCIIVTALGTGKCGNSKPSIEQCCIAQDCPIKDLKIVGLQSSYCIDQPAITLSANEGGGIFKIDGVVNDKFDPTTLGIGCKTITYDLVVNDCQYNAPSVLVCVNDLPKPTISGDTYFCAGGSATISVNENYQSYLWSNSATTKSVQVAKGGTYTVTVKDINGCEANASFTVDEKTIAKPVITNKGKDILCPDATTTLSVEPIYTDYLWSGNASIEPNLTVKSPGTYSVTVHDSFGCEASASYTVYGSTIIKPAITANGETSPPTYCTGDVVTLKATDGYAKYTWSNGVTGKEITITDSGTYTVNVENADGCPESNSITIVFNAPPTVKIEASALQICNGNEVTLSAPGVFDEITWSTGATTPNITVDESGTYEVEVKTGNCTAKSSATITVFEDQLSNLSVNANVDLVCPGDIVELEATGVNVAKSFTWVGKELLYTDGQIVQAKPIYEGYYTVTVVDQNGCFKSDSVLVKIETDCEVPNVITPNHDGFNDNWYIPQAAVSSRVDVFIFNRWGQEVYSKLGYDNADGWRGTNKNGDKLPHGTYYYVINITDNGKHSINGTITIIQ